ncbi:hypothetical protein MAR_003778, partial [Mya arenaria]
LHSRNCANDSTAELFKSKTVDVPVIGGSSIYTNTSQERCDEYCIGAETCVGLKYATSNDTCFTYSDNIAQAQKNYRFLEQNDQDQFSILNCWQSQTELQNVNGLSKEFFNVDICRDDCVFLFTSPGFPFEYPKRLNHKWELYSLASNSFFKLTFTHFNVRGRDERQNTLNSFQQCSDV